jgi:CRISPR-associated protein Csd2
MVNKNNRQENNKTKRRRNTKMKRYEFVYLYDVVDGNPNGNADAGNMPRQDAETSQGLVTDGCEKRKVRNYVEITRGGTAGYAIHVREKAILNQHQELAYAKLGLDKTKPDQASVDAARTWMCKQFYDVRTFGAVMSTGNKEKSERANCGQVRGPVQLVFGRSIDPIIVEDHSITRIAIASQKEANDQKGENRTMGRKYTVPYGLYRMHGFVNPFLADQTGFSEADLDLLWEALINLFELDRSAARGFMSARRLIVFEHESKLGNAPAYKLFEAVKVTKRVEVPRSYTDYEVTIGELPKGVTLIEKI